MFDKKPSQQSNGIADQVATSAEHAILATQNAANEALDSLANSVIELRNQAAPLLSRANGQAHDLLQSGMDGMRHASQRLGDTAKRARDGTVGYVKDEPVKSVLIAAATGAVLMALLSMASHSHRRA